MSRQGIVSSVLDFISAAIAIAFLLMLVTILVLYVIDRCQTKQAIRHNYPVVGRFRYMFEHMGEFFLQYFFTPDREESPFNRAERSWVYRAAKNVDSMIAFGSTRNLTPPSSVSFVNCPFPTLTEDAVPVADVTIGENCPQSYATHSLFDISGMSYGAISKSAILALSNGARFRVVGGTT